MISNLINNAVEALSSGVQGRVLVEMQRQTESALSPSGVLTQSGLRSEYAVIRISDNGKGISPDVLERIGQHGFSEGKADGNGLGLSHARQKVESWNGNLKVRSVLGVGTTVEMSIPLCESPRWFIPEIRIT